jgi:hypothetical protein
LKNLSLFLVLPLLGLAACTYDGGRDETASTESQLTTLTAQQCQTPSATTAPLTDSAGNPLEGSARTNLKGCVVGKTGETGKDVIGRAAAILGSTAKLATVTNAQGESLFTSLTPAGATTGSLASGLVQEADATLNVTGYSPKTRLRITRKSNADGSYAISIVNITAVNVTAGVFSVDVVQPGNFTFSATLKPEANGATVAGTSDIQLDLAPEYADQLSQMVLDIFAWLTKELAN